MEITFSKSGEVYVAEFSVTGDFNLHIEGVTAGDVQVFQRGTTSGSYARVKSVNPYSYEKVYDYDFSAVVYPKYIKIVSEVEPTLAVVTSAGEVTEIVPKNTFSIKKYDYTGGVFTPLDEPAAVFEYSGNNVTWEAFVSENSDDFYIATLGSDDAAIHIPIWRSSDKQIALTKSPESYVAGSIEESTDVIIPNHEYIGLAV